VDRQARDGPAEHACNEMVQGMPYKEEKEQVMPGQ